MKRSHVVILFVLSQVLLACSSLRVVNVNAPAVNHVFSTSGVIPVQDMSTPIWTDGFLQSRNYQGEAGTAGAGLEGYEYRIDLRNVMGVVNIPFITSLQIDIGPHARLDYDSDGRLDDVFVITSGGLGNVGVSSATKSGNVITFNFSPPVGGGASPGRGDSTFFFGLASSHARRTVTATATPGSGPALTLDAWAPNHP